jgi:hypothetical protein
VQPELAGHCGGILLQLFVQLKDAGIVSPFSFRHNLSPNLVGLGQAP